MSRNTIPTAAEVLRKAAERCQNQHGRVIVMFKHEDEESGQPIGPAWIGALGDDEVTPLATTRWDADEDGPAGSSVAWFGLSEVQDYAERIGATVEEH